MFSLSKTDFETLSGKSCRLLGKFLINHLSTARQAPHYEWKHEGRIRAAGNVGRSLDYWNDQGFEKGTKCQLDAAAVPAHVSVSQLQPLNPSPRHRPPLETAPEPPQAPGIRTVFRHPYQKQLIHCHRTSHLCLSLKSIVRAYSFLLRNSSEPLRRRRPADSCSILPLTWSLTKGLCNSPDGSLSG
jgi:hypothetical protein